MPLTHLTEDFIFEVEQSLAVRIHRAYQEPLRLYLRYLRATLDHESHLDDLTIEKTGGWVRQPKEQPKQLQGGRALGETPSGAGVRGLLPAHPARPC